MLSAALALDCCFITLYQYCTNRGCVRGKLEGQEARRRKWGNEEGVVLAEWNFTEKCKFIVRKCVSGPSRSWRACPSRRNGRRKDLESYFFPAKSDSQRTERLEELSGVHGCPGFVEAAHCFAAHYEDGQLESLCGDAHCSRHFSSVGSLSYAIRIYSTSKASKATWYLLSSDLIRLPSSDLTVEAAEVHYHLLAQTL